MRGSISGRTFTLIVSLVMFVMSISSRTFSQPASGPDALQEYVRTLESQRTADDTAKMIETLGKAAESAAKLPDVDAWVSALLPFPEELYRKFDYENAGKIYLAMLRHLPRSPKLLASYGAVLMGKGDLDAATSEFEKALALAPADPLALGNAADAAIFRRDFARAKNLLHRRMAVLPMDAGAAFDVAIVVMEDSPKASLPHWRTYLSRAQGVDDGSRPGIAERMISIIDSGAPADQLRDMAIQFNRAKLAKYAIPLLSHLERGQPSYALYPYLLAESYEVANLLTYAVRELERTRNLLTALPAAGIRMEEVRCSLARNLLAVGRRDEALQELKQVESADAAFKEHHAECREVLKKLSIH